MEANGKISLVREHKTVGRSQDTHIYSSIVEEMGIFNRANSSAVDSTTLSIKTVPCPGAGHRGQWIDFIGYRVCFAQCIA